jgi:hypothetical protein
MMKYVVALTLVFLPMSLWAKTFDCTLIRTKTVAGKSPERTYCGHVVIDASDNGRKVTIRTKCDRISVQASSFEASEASPECEKIFTARCYLLRILDRTKYESSIEHVGSLLTTSAGQLPDVFDLHDLAFDHRKLKPGIIVESDLSCRGRN